MLDFIRKVALSFPETTEKPHFEKTSFRVKHKIFATVDTANNRASIKLSLADQDIFSAFDKTIICAVPNKWGGQGWTTIDLSKVPRPLCKAAITAAYCDVAPPKLAALVSARDKV
jgi:hypothetical protein